jgi:hypothetical protein
MRWLLILDQTHVQAPVNQAGLLVTLLKDDDSVRLPARLRETKTHSSGLLAAGLENDCVAVAKKMSHPLSLLSKKQHSVQNDALELPGLSYRTVGSDPRRKVRIRVHLVLSALLPHAYHLSRTTWHVGACCRDLGVCARLFPRCDRSKRCQTLSSRVARAVLLHVGSPLKLSRRGTFFGRALPQSADKK